MRGSAINNTHSIANGGSLTVPLREYQDAANEYGKTIDPNSPIFNAIDTYRAAQKAAAGNNLTPGVFPYKGWPSFISAKPRIAGDDVRSKRYTENRQ
jgi:hypothetical protein